MTNAQLVSKIWNYAHVLRDQGVSCGDYVEQITCLPFLKMGTEREDLLGEASAIPAVALGAESSTRRTAPGRASTTGHRRAGTTAPAARRCPTRTAGRNCAVKTSGPARWKAWCPYPYPL